MRKCPRCKTEKEETQFHVRRGIVGKSVYCKVCTTEQTLERQHSFKRRCIEYKGNRCRECGYNKCDSALEFHHLDPNQKDFSIASSRLKTFSDLIRKELDKCVLLCCLCHREVHTGIRTLRV